MSAKKLVAALVAFAGATAFTACLLAMVDGMRDVAPVPGPGPMSQAAARSTGLLRTGVWLVVSMAGTAFGIALSASLIGVLR